MVSGNPNGDGFYLDPSAMTLPGSGPFSTAAAASTASTPASAAATTVSSSFSEDPSKKIRKPYTISKSRESWTDPEHDKFLEALQLFDRDWKKIEAFIGSKTAIQIRSHAQKYFLKVQKSGTGEHLPPPRPKRKAAHPYPQKAQKIGFALMLDSSKPMISIPSTSESPYPNNVQTISFSPSPKAATNTSSSSESVPRARRTEKTTDMGIHGQPLRVLPDFAQVYSFIGSVFDPCATQHLQKLKEMDRIDVETVVLLMRNLSANLASPDFEDHRRLLSSYDITDPGGGASLPLDEELST